MQEKNNDNKRIISYAQSIKEATEQMMEEDENIFIIGEGVPDPKGIFGTTINLVEKFGEKRVMDMPISENAVTGVCVGAALNGLKPIMTHQRVDFALLALDQIINNAAKWNYMFGGQKSVPIVIRLIIGRGWGQGAQHSQNLQALFAHIPGLKVVMPTTAYDAKGLLTSSIKDPNPVIFIEHRWLHNTKSHVPKELYEIEIGEPNIVKEGNDLTIFSSSYMTIEAMKIVEKLKEINLDIELIDLRSIKPINYDKIYSSVKKTKKVLVLDSGYESFGVASEIISNITQNCFKDLVAAPKKITLPDCPTPTSPALTQHYYPNTKNIAKEILKILNKEDSENFLNELIEDKLPDVPDNSFLGPF